MVIKPQLDYSDLYREPEEIWAEKHPQRADHIRVNRGLYNHHGIYVTDQEVIHFTGQDSDNVLDWSANEVITTNVDEFLRGGVLEVKEYTEEELDDLYPVDHIVQYAKACLGDKDYHLVFNNCEHFANVCTLGRLRSNQVEGVFNLGSPQIPGGEKRMGIFSTIGNAIKGLFGGNKSSGSRSASNTTYEPDKVKVAEIERDTKIQLGKMENERIEMMKNAKLELLEEEYYFKVAYEEAKARGLNSVVQSIVEMQNKLNEITEKRMQIIESGSLSIVKEIEEFYGELKERIQADGDKYKFEKAPALLEVMNNFEEGSDAYNMYKNMIDKDMDMQLQLVKSQIDHAMKRQSEIMVGLQQSKNKMVEQTGQITSGIIEGMVSNYNYGHAIEGDNPQEQLKLDGNKKYSIENKETL